MRNLDNSWDFRIGEVEILDVSKNITYILVVGYVKDNDKDYPISSLLYFRVYEMQSDDLIIGAWVEHCKKGAQIHPWFQDIRKKGTDILSLNIFEQCIDYAERMGKMQVFA